VEPGWTPCTEEDRDRFGHEFDDYDPGETARAEAAEPGWTRLTLFCRLIKKELVSCYGKKGEKFSLFASRVLKGPG
jgi:hypothetical protein